MHSISYALMIIHQNQLFTICTTKSGSKY